MQPITDGGRPRLISPFLSGVFYTCVSLQMTIFSGMDLAIRVMKFAHVFDIAMVPEKPHESYGLDKATRVIRAAYERSTMYYCAASGMPYMHWVSFAITFKNDSYSPHVIQDVSHIEVLETLAASCVYTCGGLSLQLKSTIPENPMSDNGHRLKKRSHQ